MARTGPATALQPAADFFHGTGHVPADPADTIVRRGAVLKPVRALVVALVLVVAVEADHAAATYAESGVQVARHVITGSATPMYGQEQVDLINALRGELAAQVPRGSRVAVGTYPAELTAFHQRLAEVAVLEKMRLTANGVPQYRLDVVADDRAAVHYRLVAESA